MADTQVNSNINAPTCMESINRIAKLPAVECSFQTASNIYEKIKEYNGMTQWTCSTAESVVHKAVEVGKPIAVPIVQGLEVPIKKVDDVLCSGLDYVESKIPAVKLPPGEIYDNTKEYVNNTVTPAVGAAYSYIEPVVKSAYEKLEPAIESAKTAVEPAVEKAKTLVDPLVQPALDKVQSLKEYGTQKLEEIIHSHNHPEENLECEDCQAAARRMEENQQ